MFCNSFVKDTNVHLRARLAFVCEIHLQEAVRKTFV